MIRTGWMGWLLLAGLLSSGLTGCEVVRAGVFVATVPHYHGGAERVSITEPVVEPAPIRVPPRVTPEAKDE